MSDKPNDGWPAFPHGPIGASFAGPDGYTAHQGQPHPGMTLRDWFAGMYMSAGKGPLSINGEPYEETCARDAYKYADAMLKAREQK